MKPGVPWSVKGIEPDVREAAKIAARRSGMTLGEWLNSKILETADDIPDSRPDMFARKSAAPSHALERTASRLEDIAVIPKRRNAQLPMPTIAKPYTRF